MEIKSGFASAVTGMQRGMEGVDRNAAAIARASTGEGDDVTAPLVESRLHQTQVEANAKVFKELDEMLGSLLDELA